MEIRPTRTTYVVFLGGLLLLLGTQASPRRVMDLFLVQCILLEFVDLGFLYHASCDCQGQNFDVDQANTYSLRMLDVHE